MRGRETLRERHERGLCSGQCDNVSPPGTLGAVLSFQCHRLSVPTLNCYGSKLPFCAATDTFRRDLYCESSSHNSNGIEERRRMRAMELRRTQGK